MGASVTLGAPSIAVDPGGEARLDLRLRNTGGVVDEFTLEVLGDAAGWTTVEPPTISLFPGAEGGAVIVFRPPRTSTVPPGPMPFGLRAVSREDPEGSTVEEGTVEVGAFIAPTAELVPRTSHGSMGATHELAVDNRGNARLNAELTASDADQLLRFDLKPPGVVVEPGMAGFAKLLVNPVKRFWRGQPKTRAFQVVVTPEGYLPITLDGALLQESLLPSWFGRAVMALIGLLIAAVILWFLVLRPTIQSTASEALATPLAELRGDINDAFSAGGLPTLPAAGGGGASPAPSPSPGASPGPGVSPGPSPSPPGPVIAGLGVPIDGRLDDTTKSFSPTDTTFITDLVFSNPNGRTGAVVLLRGADPLLTLRLENFRDLDFHFVTPILVQSGEALILDLSCDQSPCDPSLFYAGYERPGG